MNNILKTPPNGQLHGQFQFLEALVREYSRTALCPLQDSPSCPSTCVPSPDYASFLWLLARYPNTSIHEAIHEVMQKL